MRSHLNTNLRAKNTREVWKRTLKHFLGSLAWRSNQVYTSRKVVNLLACSILCYHCPPLTLPNTSHFASTAIGVNVARFLVGVGVGGGQQARYQNYVAWRKDPSHMRLQFSIKSGAQTVQLANPITQLWMPWTSRVMQDACLNESSLLVNWL